eukprot:m.79471 g.79471  ORF g.79471 m.79471 type:complete len:54 (-) comp25219_c1_seq2:228-389(-)
MWVLEDDTPISRCGLCNMSTECKRVGVLSNAIQHRRDPDHLETLEYLDRGTRI